MDRMKSLGHIEVLPVRITYETPRFEQETMSALGLPVLPDWRTTDAALISFDRDSPDFEAPHPGTVERWERFRFGSQIVALRQCAGDNSAITVESVYPSGGYLRRTVSYREPVRADIGFWTSRNRVARVTGVRRLSQFLTLLQQENSYGYRRTKHRLCRRGVRCSPIDHGSDWMVKLPMEWTILLRFRDLVDATIPQHVRVIRDAGEVWWGWWRKADEPQRLKELAKVQSSARNGYAPVRILY